MFTLRAVAKQSIRFVLAMTIDARPTAKKAAMISERRRGPWQGVVLGLIQIAIGIEKHPKARKNDKSNHQIYKR